MANGKLSTLFCKVVTKSKLSVILLTMNDPVRKHCPFESTLKIIGSRWTMHILHFLFDGKKRFGEIAKALAPISPKTLSLRLKDLEKEGIVSKKVYPQIPLKVEYKLTPKGQSLKRIFDDMTAWGVKA